MVKINRKGFTTIELIGAMIIISILSVASVSAISQAVLKSRYIATLQDLQGFTLPVGQFLLEHSKQYPSGLAVVDCSVDLNEYLEGDMKFSHEPGIQQHYHHWQTKRKDPWGTPYRIYVHSKDLSATGNSSMSARDKELRAFIISHGPDQATADTTNNWDVDGLDDMFVMLECVNGKLSVGYYGFSTARDDSVFAAYNSTVEDLSLTAPGSYSDKGIFRSNGLGKYGSIYFLQYVTLADSVTAK